MVNTLDYLLPDGRIVPIAYDLCHGMWSISFTLKGGAIVSAVRMSNQDAVTAAYRVWKAA